MSYVDNLKVRTVGRMEEKATTRRFNIFSSFLLMNIPENLQACIYYIYICELVSDFKDFVVLPRKQMNSKLYRDYRRRPPVYNSVSYRSPPNEDNFYRLGLHSLLELLNRDSINYYSIDFALYGKQLETFKFLINNGAQIRPYHFYHAINDYDILKYMIDKKGKVEIKKDIIKDALYKKCDIKIIELLVDAGVKIKDENILDAAYEAREDVIELLMSKGAKMRDKFIADVLNRCGDRDKLKLLVKYGAKIKDYRILGDCYVKLDDLKFFLDSGIDINHFNLVKILSVECNLHIVKFLIDNGAKIGSKEIQFIIENKHRLCKDGIIFLIEYILLRTGAKFPPILIHLKSNKSSIDYLHFLLDKGAVLDTKSISSIIAYGSGYTEDEILDVLNFLSSRDIKFPPRIIEFASINQRFKVAKFLTDTII